MSRPAEEIRIEECGPEHAEELAEIARTTFRETYSAKTSAEDMRDHVRDAYSPRAILAQLTTPGSRFYIARAGGQAAGYMKVNTGEAQGERLEGVGLEIEAVYLHRRFQGQGIGRLMLEHARAEAEAAGADHIWLGVWELNGPAIRLYERIGFEVVGSHRFRFASVEHTDLLMRREL